MMRILITGRNGYIGNALADWLAQWPDAYGVDKVSLRGEDWKTHSFRGYDVVFHGAGLAHDNRASADEQDFVNRRLAIAAAEKAKGEGVRLFLLMSTMAVYGKEGRMGKKCEIGPYTAPDPQTAYGRSKLLAENGVMALHDDDFAVRIIRSPMVYGANCPGNYRRLRNVALRFGIVPNIHNERSMIYISHLCEFLRLCMHLGEEKTHLMEDTEGRPADPADLASQENPTGARFPRSGILFPMDTEPFCTAQVMEWIAQANGNKRIKSRLLGAWVRVGAAILPVIQKAFGNLTYTEGLSSIPPEAYCRMRLEEAVRETEAKWGSTDGTAASRSEAQTKESS